MSAGAPRSALIADDHAVVRGGLRALLERLPRVAVVGEASDGIETIALARRHRPDLLTLDAGMAHSGGMEAYAEVRRWSPETRICLVTGLDSVGVAAQWIAAGVEGYLLKSAPAEEMALAFSLVLEGGRYVDPRVEAALEAAPEDTLSLRERQVLHMIAAGMTNPEMAARLSISAKTVENHRTRMMAKLGVRSAAQLLAYALREGLLDGGGSLTAGPRTPDAR